jgi:protein subunit release factor A
VHKSQGQNKKAAFHKLGQLILNWHRAQEFKERVRVNETIRTYHEVENRVKDHLSGEMTSFDEVEDDLSEMIYARRKAILDEIHETKTNNGSPSPMGN